MVGESWDVFTMRVLVVKHINDIMYENPGGHAPLCRRPWLLPVCYIITLRSFQSDHALFSNHLPVVFLSVHVSTYSILFCRCVLFLVYCISDKLYLRI